MDFEGDRFTDWYGMDTENDQTGKVTLACLIHESGDTNVWHRSGEIVKWCEKVKGKKPVVICHNLEYDLVNEFGDKYPYMNLNYLKGRLISAKYHNITFWDSFNHFRMSLKSLGDSLGIKKLDMNIYSEEYVATDAWIALKSMTGARDFIASLGGQIGATSGSSSVSIWRYMTDDEYCLGPIDTPWLRQGYYGGRTEIFAQQAEGDCKCYDVNSMYPYCMLREYPEYTMEDLGMNKGKGMAEVLIHVPEKLFIAPLPYRSKDGLVYPVGIFRGTWTYDEIRFAEQQGAKVLKVYKAYGGNTMLRPFSEYIETLYARRKASDNPAERLFLKVLMNALYGKIASKNMVTRTVSRYSLVKSGNRRLEDVVWIDQNRGLLDYQTPPQPYVNVLWGSMITAYSRLTLTEYFMDVPPDKLIYGDTDSIWCVNHDLPTDPELGSLKLEKQFNRLRIYQPKVYQADDNYIAKGVPKPRVEGDTKKNFAREYMEDGMTEFQAPIRFRQSLNSKRGSANQWITMKKSMKTEYNKKRFVNGRYFPPIIEHQLQLKLK